MADVPVEKRFAVLCEITRAQHFAWREAVASVVSDDAARRAVLEMWERTGRTTAAAYVKRLDPGRPLALQVAEGIAWSSVCMGEDAVVEKTAGTADEAFVRHRDCPWLHWHRRKGLLEEDQPGCDAWFRSTVDEINRVLGTNLRVETTEALPAGAPSCLRRFWVEGRGSGRASGPVPEASG